MQWIFERMHIAEHCEVARSLLLRSCLKRVRYRLTKKRARLLLLGYSEMLQVPLGSESGLRKPEGQGSGAGILGHLVFSLRGELSAYQSIFPSCANR